MNVGDADRVEELAEIAAAFLTEIGAQRGLVFHGDEANSAPVTQAFFGLSYEEIDALHFDYADIAEQSTSVYSRGDQARQVLLAPLRDASGDCLGMLYADTLCGFVEGAVDSLDRFALQYLDLLLDICISRPALPVRRLKREP